MADDQDKSQQTEEASPKRVEDARKKGQVPVSREPSTAIAFLVFSGIGITGVAAFMGERMIQMMQHYLSATPSMLRADGPGMQSLLFDLGADMAALILPLVIPMLIFGVLATFMISGPVFTFETLKPKFSKVNPMSGLKRMFSTKGLAEFIKSLIKLCVISLTCWLVMSDLLPHFIGAGRLQIEEITILGIDSVLHLAALTSLVFFFIAMSDVLYQRWEHAKGLKMSKKELRDENKDTEGDPFIKAKIRQLQQEMARRRMMADVPKADVVITNPTHYAIALSYTPGSFGAPKVLAKGKGVVAQKIKEIAREHGVPMRENRPLARSLYKSVKVGHDIPEELYEAVAVILAEIFRMKTEHY